MHNPDFAARHRVNGPNCNLAEKHGGAAVVYFPFVHSLDHLGPLARSVADLALAYDAMQGPDPADPVATCACVSFLDLGRGPKSAVTK